MISCFKQKYILLLAIGFILGGQSSLFAKETVGFNHSLGSKNLIDVIFQNQSLLAQRNNLCKKVNLEYQEIYSFETEEYYINICQFDNDFYYSRRSKDDADDNVLVAAKSVFGGDVFQATDNRTIYFVGKDGDRYYSSVMHNNSEIVFEPELEESILSLDKSSQNPLDTSIPIGNNLQRESKVGVDLELDTPGDLTQDSLVCTNKSSAFHPDLNGWQKLIGKSSDIANQYALKNGHDFSYSNAPSREATIKTKEGALINLNIATGNDLIERVCIKAIAENI